MLNGLFIFGAEKNNNLLGVYQYTIDNTVDICELVALIHNFELVYISVRGSFRKKKKRIELN